MRQRLAITAGVQEPRSATNQLRLPLRRRHRSDQRAVEQTAMIFTDECLMIFQFVGLLERFTLGKGYLNIDQGFWLACINSNCAVEDRKMCPTAERLKRGSTT